MDPVQGVSVAFLRPLAELLTKLGLDGPGFLARFGVDEQTAPNTYVPAADLDHALDVIAKERQDPAFAVTLAKLATARPLGLFGHLIWLSGTVGDALERAVKFWVVVSKRSTLVLEEHPGFITIRQVPAVAERGRILVEFPFASLAARARSATEGTFRLRDVRFRHAGESTPAYEELFGVPVHFGASDDAIDIAVEQLALPLVSSDPITSAALEAKIAQLTAAAPVDLFLDRVRRVAGDGSPAAIAKALGISERTLRRQLEQHGTTLRELADQTQRERADGLLAAGKTVKEVAFELGFSEPSAFSRAYKRWTGKAPSST